MRKLVRRRSREPFLDGFGVKVGRQALDHGLLCRFDPNWIAFGPPLISLAYVLVPGRQGCRRPFPEEHRRDAPAQLGSRPQV
jgi:hypothetical protein